MHAILKDLVIYRDGYTRETLAAGTEADIPAELVAGLIEGGFIAAKEGQSQSDDQGDDGKPVMIPSDWATLHHAKRIALAKLLGGAPGTAAEANAIIEAELAKRG